MREIKFRAEYEGKIYPVAEISFSDSGTLVTLVGGGLFIVHIDNVNLMQYTGLKDKNGKEIYEGDIIKLNAGDEGFTAPVVYNDEKAGFDLEHPDGYHGHWGLDWKIVQACEYEIIGNIYEHSHLLDIK